MKKQKTINNTCIDCYYYDSNLLSSVININCRINKFRNQIILSVTQGMNIITIKCEQFKKRRKYGSYKNKLECRIYK
jgi:hypothetical protein